MIRGSDALKVVWNLVAPASADVEQHPAICLPFQDHYTLLLTKPFSFNDILRSDALTLENLRELTACRAQAYENANLSADDKLTWIERYLALLTNFAGKAAAIDGNNEYALQFEWTSPLTGSNNTFYTLKGVTAEQAVHIAETRVEELQASPEQHAAASALFRRAAGVYDYANTAFIQQLTSTNQADRPAELRPSMACALAKLALGQAQVITAHRAQVKGSSPALLASLHCGAVELFEEASSLLKPGDDTKQSSERLRKAIALSSNLSKIRAWKAVAAREAERTNLGVACADLQESMRLSQESCQVAQGSSGWQQGFQQEMQTIQQQSAVLDRERQVVYFQAVAKQCSALPSGKVIVNVSKFEPLVLQHELG